MGGVNPRPRGSDHRDGEGEPDGRLFRLERLLGFREPREHGPSVRVLLAFVGVAALLLSVFSVFASPPPPPPDTPSYRIPLVVFVVLLVQWAGDSFYRSNRGLSALLRVGARLVGLPAVAALYAAAAYSVDGARGALFVGGAFFALVALAVLLGRV